MWWVSISLDVSTVVKGEVGLRIIHVLNNPPANPSFSSRSQARSVARSLGRSVVVVRSTRTGGDTPKVGMVCWAVLLLALLRYRPHDTKNLFYINPPTRCHAYYVAQRHTMPCHACMPMPMPCCCYIHDGCHRLTSGKPLHQSVTR